MKQRVVSLFLVFTVALSALALLSWGVSNAAPRSIPEDFEADLGIQLASEPRPVLVSGPISYTLVITSDQLEAVTAVTLTLGLPDIIADLVYAPEQGVFDPISGAWVGFALSATSPITLHIGGFISASDAAAAGIAELTSMAAVVTDQAPDPHPDNNTADDLNELIFSADLSLAFTSQPTPITAGTALTYTAVVRSDNDLITVTTVNLAFDLDPALGDLTYTPSAGTFDQESGDWEGFSLTPQSPITLTIVSLVDPAVTGTIVSAATLTTSQIYDPFPENNIITDTNPIVRLADLSVAKSASHTPALAGAPLTYTITIHNHGPSDVAAVVLTDTLPAQVTFLGSSEPDHCSLEPGDLLICVWPYLAAEESIELLALVELDIEASGSLVNQVEVSGDAEDPDPDNNFAETITPITAIVANLSVSKAASQPTAVAGELLTYTITLTNAGPADATGVVLTDTLPAMVEFVTADYPGCALENGAVVCVWDILPAESQVELNIVVAVDPAARGSLTNLVEVGSDMADLEPNNNSDTAVTPIVAIVALSLDKSASSLTVIGRAPFTYTLVLTNAGPSAALETTLVDNWPSGLELLNSPPNCDIAGSVISCDIGALPPGAAVSVQLLARATTVSHVNTINLTNNAAAASDAGDSNEASVTVSITPYQLFLGIIIQPPEWQQVGNIPDGVTAFYDLAACGNELLAGANNGIYRWQGNSWQRQTDGPANLTAQFAFSGANCNRAYAASFGGGLWLGVRVGSNWNWTQINNELQWARSVVVRENTVFVAGDFGLYQANTAAHIFTPTSLTTRVNNLTLDGNGTTLWATVWNDGVFVNNGGSAWTRVGSPTNAAVWRVIGDGGGSPLLLGLETGVNLWSGDNWAATAAGYTNRARAVAAAEGALYATQQGNGIIASYDGGQSWRLINTRLPIIAGGDDFYSLRAMGDGYLYLTGEIGVWRWPIP